MVFNVGKAVFTIFNVVTAVVACSALGDDGFAGFHPPSPAKVPRHDAES